MFDLDEFVKILKEIKGVKLFNPYTDTCSICDGDGGYIIRENNLRNYLTIVDKTDTIVVGEAPGYLGCRRTGLPFTDNDHLETVQRLFDLNTFEIATITGKNKENSALYMWRVIEQLDNYPFVWNIIPMHPYQKDNPLSNRTPNKIDFHISNKAIYYLLENGNFNKIIAIGRVAEKYIKKLGYECKYVRHPSHGGSNIFKTQMLEYLS